MNALVPINNGGEVYRQSTDAAGLCREIVLKTAKPIQGRKFVSVEGWQAIAIAHGCAAGARDVEKVDGGVRAVGEIRRMSDGQIIAVAEGFVGEDEPTWYGGESVSYGKRKVLPKRADYAIRAMAQTRAISRACRSAFAHVVVMIDADLSTTPAEEVPEGGFVDVTPEPKASAPVANGMPDEEYNRLVGKMKVAGVTEAKLFKQYGVGNLRLLSQDQYGDAMKRLDSAIAEKSKSAPPADQFGNVDDVEFAQ
ncbi:hypothetical protein [Sphingopyxis sp. Geo48]|uniref:hypothetical protein n=1 Tax=Sphingopyxis sp. Geo48 TaxID=545241 RepID=UPI0024B81C06|nr:hypothetical protein [Sphingopyxis sp. Geo48]